MTTRLLTILTLVSLCSATPRPVLNPPSTVSGRPGAAQGTVSTLAPVTPEQSAAAFTQLAGDAPQATGPASAGSPPVAALSTMNGWASWYDNGPGLYGAVRSWHWGDDPYMVLVSSIRNGRIVSVHVMVRDYCQCGSRHGIPTVIDLSPAAFRELAPLSAGIVRVQVSGPIRVPLGPSTLPTPPPTDVAR